MLKIAFVALMGGGKTFLSNKLVNHYGGKVVSFAAQLKQDVIDLKLTPDGTINKARDRKLLQDYGQFRRGDLQECETSAGILKNNNGEAWLYNEGEKPLYVGKSYSDYWLNKGIAEAKKVSETQNVYIDDARFVNEAETLRKEGFCIIKIIADEETRIERLIARDGGYNRADFSNISEMQFYDIIADYEIKSDHDDGAFQNLMLCLEQRK